MAYNNYQQVPAFWDFTRAFDRNRAGVDHPAEGFNSFPPPPASAPGTDGPHPPPPPQWGFPFDGQGFWDPHHPHHPHPRGFGRGGRRGRHCRHRDDNDGDENTPHGSRSPSNGKHPEGEARETSASRGPRGHHGRRRGGWGFGGRGGHRGPAFAFSGAGVPGPGTGFDLSALFESLSAHPLAQAFRTYVEAQRSGETAVPEDVDAENSFIPPVDVFSTEKAYVLHAALPGAKKENVGVNWDGDKGLLTLAGVVYRPGDEEFLKSLARSERKVGVFERAVKLPPGNNEEEEIDGDAIAAKLEDGVLVITVPKVEKEWTEVKKVDIN